jgi:hypothetical protein
MKHKVKRCKECFKYYLGVDYIGNRVNGYCSAKCEDYRNNIIKNLDPRIAGNGMSYLELKGEPDPS